jgi:hypothetical protein
MKPKQNEIGDDLCPCCGNKMFLLEDGIWTHIFSKAFREATKRDNLKGAIKFDEADKADKILEKLGKLKCDFSSVKSGDIEDLKEYNKIMEPIRELKKEDMDKLRHGLNKEEPLKTIQRLLILYEVDLAKIYYISQELKELFEW